MQAILYDEDELTALCDAGGYILVLKRTVDGSPISRGITIGDIIVTRKSDGHECVRVLSEGVRGVYAALRYQSSGYAQSVAQRLTSDKPFKGRRDGRVFIKDRGIVAGAALAFVKMLRREVTDGDFVECDTEERAKDEREQE